MTTEVERKARATLTTHRVCCATSGGPANLTEILIEDVTALLALIADLRAANERMAVHLALALRGRAEEVCGSCQVLRAELSELTSAIGAGGRP